ncbi:RND superfamily putative drug exporter [Streptomyces syringium]|uniref:RND superfamily putative drug exporter n=1 Tax=Streptomyces syringium TaxID=76729 RepID=A0ABS4Y2U8_9ACTN|nr:RND superfamily putative drug exporter [Streptomyces syringium]
MRLTPRGAWVVLLLVSLFGCVAAIGALGTHARLAPEAILPSSAESVRAEAVLVSRFGAGEPHLVLLATASGSVDEQRAAMSGRELTDRLTADPRTAWVRSYWPRRPAGLRTADRHRALVLVRFHGDERAARAAGDDVVARYTGRAGPLRVSAAGGVAVLSESDRLSERGLRLAEIVAMPLVLVVLLWTFGSAVAALIPVAVGVLAVVGTTAFLRLLTEVTTVSAFALNITTALGFGLAVDYCLFLVSRFREELARGEATGAAVRATLRTAGRAVTFSGAVVAVCLCTLLVFPLPLVRSIAYGGVAVVLASVAGVLLVVPALLVLLGERVNRLDVFARLRPRGRTLSAEGAGAWYRLALWVTRRPAAVAVGVLLLLGLLAAPAALTRFGMYGDRLLPQSSPVARTSQEVRAAFAATVSDRPSVVLLGPRATRSAEVLDGFARRLSRVPGVQRVDTATGSYRQGLRSALPPGSAERFTADGATRLSVVPSPVRSAGPSTGPGPQDGLTPQGSRLAARLRAVPAPAPVLVGGAGARLDDVEGVLAGRLPPAVGFAASATFVLLLVFTRSLLIPAKALLLNALSLMATFGLLVAVFQEGWTAGPFFGPAGAGVTDVIAPLMFSVAFGLSMDYEMFLLSRIVEEHRRGAPTSTAVATGLQYSGRLFTSAAVVFATVTASLALSDLLHLQVVGTGLAVAVLLDCTVIRALLVPAVMQLVGRANWWLPGARGFAVTHTDRAGPGRGAFALRRPPGAVPSGQQDRQGPYPVDDGELPEVDLVRPDRQSRGGEPPQQRGPGGP